MGQLEWGLHHQWINKASQSNNNLAGSLAEIRNIWWCPLEWFAHGWLISLFEALVFYAALVSTQQLSLLNGSIKEEVSKVSEAESRPDNYETSSRSSTCSYRSAATRWRFQTRNASTSDIINVHNPNKCWRWTTFFPHWSSIIHLRCLDSAHTSTEQYSTR